MSERSATPYPGFDLERSIQIPRAKAMAHQLPRDVGPWKEYIGILPAMNDISPPLRFLPPLQLGLACLAMLATLPGRSVGLGLITEDVIADLDVERAVFGAMNFIATIIGASFAILCGWLIDRFGLRLVTATVAILLAGVTALFSTVASAVMLVVLLTLMRGLGQSALSTASMTIIGKWFTKTLSIAMAIFSVVIAVGFAGLVIVMKELVEDDQVGWRATWMWIAFAIGALAVIFVIGLRRAPVVQQRGSESGGQRDETGRRDGVPLSFALRTPAFWAFAIGSAFYNLVIAGVLLWNESILEEVGFTTETYQTAIAMFMLFGLAGNIVTGFLARHVSLGKLMSLALLLLAASLIAYPFLSSEIVVHAHAALFGATGGAITVLFFTAWATMFGRAQLGRIQGAAQIMAVIASATGPFVFGGTFDWRGSYAPAFFVLAPIAVALAVFAWVVRVPVGGSGESGSRGAGE